MAPTPFKHGDRARIVAKGTPLNGRIITVSSVTHDRQLDRVGASFEVEYQATDTQPAIRVWHWLPLDYLEPVYVATETPNPTGGTL